LILHNSIFTLAYSTSVNKISLKIRLQYTQWLKIYCIGYVIIFVVSAEIIQLKGQNSIFSGTMAPKSKVIYGRIVENTHFRQNTSFQLSTVVNDCMRARPEDESLVTVMGRH
jgi:hypothetical protein